MNKRNFAFDKKNFIFLAIGMIIVIVGFLLMSGSGSTEDTFNPEIFSARRIKIAPIVCVAGYLFMVYAILRKPAASPDDNIVEDETEKDVIKETEKKDSSFPRTDFSNGI